ADRSAPVLDHGLIVEPLRVDGDERVGGVRWVVRTGGADGGAVELPVLRHRELRFVVLAPRPLPVLHLEVRAAERRVRVYHPVPPVGLAVVAAAERPLLE